MLAIFGTGIVIAVSIAWFEYRKHAKALDVLRIYAERGQEPPEAVVQALMAISPRAPAKPAAPTPRSWHLAHVAANGVFTAGLGGLAWWRHGETGEAGTLVIVSILAALFFAAAVAARLVGAYYARQ